MKLITTFLITLLIGLSFGGDRLEKIQADIETRMWKQGNSTRINSTVFYHVNGTMLTHFSHPFERIIRTNHLGEFLIYDPETGEVIREQNRAMSSESNHFFHFFQNKTEEMGLDQLGFEQGDTEFDENIRITTWYAPTHLAQTVEYVELVHDRFRPIFMGAYNRQGEVIQKTYFHNYIDILDYEFPQSITIIDFETPTDSTVSQTRFRNIRINEDVNPELMEIQIPDPDEIE